MARQKEYSNGDITIVWEAEKCIHSERCWRGLSDVFDPQKRPWINANGAETATITAQIDQCPSGALRYRQQNKDQAGHATTQQTSTKVTVLADGPLIVNGTIEVELQNGDKVTKQDKTALCRCGHSDQKPYCDGSHSKAGFKS